MITFALIVTSLLPSSAPTDFPRPVSKVFEAHLNETNCKAKALILQQRNDPNFVSFVCLIDGVAE